MRLGGKITPAMATPEAWIAAVQAKGYRAAYCPVGIDAEADTIEHYRSAAESAGIIIAEVGGMVESTGQRPRETPSCTGEVYCIVTAGGCDWRTLLCQYRWIARETLGWAASRELERCHLCHDCRDSAADH